jgi:transposase
VEGKGKPVAFVLTRGQQHEARVFEELMTLGEVKRTERGHPRIRPQRVCGDKGYSSRKIRTYLRRRGISYAIPRKRIERRTGPFDKARYRLRNLVERAINRLKQFRRTATRYEKRADNYLAMLQIGSILLWL